MRDMTLDYDYIDKRLSDDELKGRIYEMAWIRDWLRGLIIVYGENERSVVYQKKFLEIIEGRLTKLRKKLREENGITLELPVRGLVADFREYQEDQERVKAGLPSVYDE